MIEETIRIQTISDELAACFADYMTLANAYKDNMQLRALLAAIIAETEVGTDGDIYVRIGGGLRLLPSGMIAAIRVAKEYLNA
jgi:hypothetical protein